MLKRMCACLIGLLLLGAAGAEAPLCVVEGKVACMVDRDGDTLLRGPDIEDAFIVREDALYAAGRKGEYRLYNASGDPLGETAFAMIEDQGDCLIFRSGSRYGAMAADGSVLLPATWTQLTSDGAGGWLALDTDPLDESPDAILHIDANGEATPTGARTSIGLSRLRSGRMPIAVPNGRYGAVNARGTVVISAEWRAMGAFLDGCAKATGPDGMGLIDPDGAVLAPTIYRWLERGEGIIAALRDDGLDVYASDGTALFGLEGENLEATLAGRYIAVTSGAITRLYDGAGAVIAESDAGVSYAPGTRGQLIVSDGAWGERCAWLMNSDGSAASGRFQRILPLCEGRYAFLEMEGAEYYSAELDRVQTSWNYDTIRYGLMDGAGNILAPAEYRKIRALGADRLLMVTNEEIRLTDADGESIASWLTAEAEAPTGEAAS